MKKTITFLMIALVLFSLCINSVFAGGGSDAGGQSGGKTTLTFLTFLNPADDTPRSRGQNQIIEDFKKKYPNVNLEVQVLAWSEINTRLIQAASAGNPPDISRVNYESMEQHFAADTLLSLNPYIDKMPNAEAFKSGFLMPYTLAMHNGQKMALGIDHRAIFLFYNKNHLKELGLTVPPKTWDGVAAVAQQAAARGHVGMAIGLSPAASGNAFLEWFKPVVWDAGGDLLDENKKAIFNSPAGVRAMQLLYDFVHKYNAIPQDILATDVEGTFQAFQAGRVSMMAWGNHRFTTAQQTMNVNGADLVGIMSLPSFDGTKPSPAHVSGALLAIPKGAANPDLAWSFIENHLSIQSYVTNARVGGELPAHNSAFTDPWFTNDTLGKEFLSWRDYIRDYGRMPVAAVDTPRLHDILCNAAQRIVLQHQPIQATLDAAAREFDTK